MCLHCASPAFDVSLCCEILPFFSPLFLTLLRLPPLFCVTNTLLHHCDVPNVKWTTKDGKITTFAFGEAADSDQSPRDAARTQIIKYVRLRPAVPGAASVHEEAG